MASRRGTNFACGFLLDGRFARTACHGFNSGALLCVHDSVRPCRATGFRTPQRHARCLHAGPFSLLRRLPVVEGIQNTPGTFSNYLFIMNGVMYLSVYNLRSFSQFLIFSDHVSGPNIQATGGAGVDRHQRSGVSRKHTQSRVD